MSCPHGPRAPPRARSPAPPPPTTGPADPPGSQPCTRATGPKTLHPADRPQSHMGLPAAKPSNDVRREATMQLNFRVVAHYLGCLYHGLAADRSADLPEHCARYSPVLPSMSRQSAPRAIRPLPRLSPPPHTHTHPTCPARPTSPPGRTASPPVPPVRLARPLAATDNSAQHRANPVAYAAHPVLFPSSVPPPQALTPSITGR